MAQRPVPLVNPGSNPGSNVASGENSPLAKHMTHSPYTLPPALSNPNTADNSRCPSESGDHTPNDPLSLQHQGNQGQSSLRGADQQQEGSADHQQSGKRKARFQPQQTHQKGGSNAYAGAPIRVGTNATGQPQLLGPPSQHQQQQPGQPPAPYPPQQHNQQQNKGHHGPAMVGGPMQPPPGVTAVAAPTPQYPSNRPQYAQVPGAPPPPGAPAPGYQGMAPPPGFNAHQGGSSIAPPPPPPPPQHQGQQPSYMSGNGGGARQGPYGSTNPSGTAPAPPQYSGMPTGGGRSAFPPTGIPQSGPHQPPSPHQQQQPQQSHPHPSGPSAQQMPPGGEHQGDSNIGKKECRHFLQGKCTWGENCRFKHSGANVGSSGVGVFQPPGAPPPPPPGPPPQPQQLNPVQQQQPSSLGPSLGPSPFPTPTISPHASLTQSPVPPPQYGAAMGALSSQAQQGSRGVEGQPYQQQQTQQRTAGGPYPSGSIGSGMAGFVPPTLAQQIEALEVHTRVRSRTGSVTSSRPLTPTSYPLSPNDSFNGGLMRPEILTGSTSRPLSPHPEDAAVLGQQYKAVSGTSTPTIRFAHNPYVSNNPSVTTTPSLVPRSAPQGSGGPSPALTPTLGQSATLGGSE